MQHRTHQGKNSFRDMAYLGLIALFLLLSLPAVAELGNIDGFDTDPDGMAPPSGGVEAAGGDGFVGGMLVDPNGIGNNEALEGDGLGRREKTDDALARGGEGVAAAIAAGTALTAAGVAKLPWPTTPQGVALIALGALEFAQAGATAGVNGENTSGRNVLTEGTETGEQAQGQGASPSPEQVRQTISEQINTPELQQALAENGVNSDDFVDRLASGELRSFEDIMSAVNNPNEFSADQIAGAQADAANFASGVFGEPENKELGQVARIKPDDSQSKPNGKHGDEGGQGPGTIAAVAASAVSDENKQALEEAKNMIRKAEKLADAELAQLQRAGLGAGLSRDALVRKYLAQLQKKKKSNPLGNLSRTQLADLGIKRLRKSQRIFELGRRTYVTYGKWRDKALEKERRERLRRMQARVASGQNEIAP